MAWDKTQSIAQGLTVDKVLFYYVVVSAVGCIDIFELEASPQLQMMSLRSLGKSPLYKKNPLKTHPSRWLCCRPLLHHRDSQSGDGKMRHDSCPPIPFCRP